VQVSRVDLDGRRIDFRLADAEGNGRPVGEGQRRGEGGSRSDRIKVHKTPKATAAGEAAAPPAEKRGRAGKTSATRGTRAERGRPAADAGKRRKTGKRKS
jgi:ribonuclease R